MGQVEVGDQVFDEQGGPATVTYKSPVFPDHDCYQVRFDDGSTIVADAEHQWTTWTGSEPPITSTTLEIAEVLRTTAPTDPDSGLRVPVAGPLQCPEVEFPLDPYLLGCQLGSGPEPDLAPYLRASADQRRALFQGITESGRCVAVDEATYRLTGSSCRLTGDVRELALSLGCQVDPVAFPLTFSSPPSPGGEARWRAIVEVRPVPSVPTQCITVDAPSRLYLAGRDMIPTHNTAFALGMAANSAMKDDRPVLIFTLEMSQLELSQRLLCSEALVDSGKVKTGRLEEAEWTRISHAVGRLAETPIYIDDNPHTSVMDIRAKARRLRSREGDLGLVIVDYIQLMTGRSGAESRQVEVSEISRNLKILARELEAPVVALAQLNRSLEQRTDKRPMLSDLRESGSLEQDADVVMFLYRDEVYDEASPDKGVAEVIVAKHRNGPTGKVRLAFRGQFTRFDNMARSTPGGPPESGSGPGSDF
jgi:replicative DNA helicase